MYSCLRANTHRQRGKSAQSQRKFFHQKNYPQSIDTDYFSKNLKLNKKSAKVKILESIRGEKEMQENLTFAYDSVKTENKNKEVLECQLVTTS
jgi:hypothetical protein